MEINIRMFDLKTIIKLGITDHGLKNAQILLTAVALLQDLELEYLLLLSLLP